MNDIGRCGKVLRYDHRWVTGGARLGGVLKNRALGVDKDSTNTLWGIDGKFGKPP